MPLKIRFMHRQDILQVQKIDRDAFPTEWPPTNFTRELNNKMARYIVAYNSDDVETQSSSTLKRTEKKPGFLTRILKSLFPGKFATYDPLAESIPILGYAGMWLMADEAHVTNIASHNDHRHQGIGEAMLMSLIELATENKARILTLEVRVSNKIAQNLYLKYGFDELGIRKGYYLDNKEDAMIMSTEFIGSASFREKLRKAKQNYVEKWGEFSIEL